MTTITVKTIPDDLYERLKVAAQANHRSVNTEIIVCIERTVAVHRIDPEALLPEARRLRRLTADAPITDAEFNLAKAVGRSCSLPTPT
jgi:plasmid stability protein